MLTLGMWRNPIRKPMASNGAGWYIYPVGKWANGGIALSKFFPELCGHVAELVYAYDSESYPARVGSSSLPVPTQFRMAYGSPVPQRFALATGQASLTL